MHSLSSVEHDDEVRGSISSRSGAATRILCTPCCCVVMRDGDGEGSSFFLKFPSKLTSRRRDPEPETGADVVETIDASAALDVDDDRSAAPVASAVLLEGVLGMANTNSKMNTPQQMERDWCERRFRIRFCDHQTLQQYSPISQ